MHKIGLLRRNPQTLFFVRLLTIILGLICISTLLIILLPYDLTLPHMAGTRSQAHNATVENKQKNPCQTVVCPSKKVEWINVRSENPKDVLTAAKKTSLYQHSVRGQTDLATALRKGVAGQPQKVKPYRSDSSLQTYWIIPMLDRTHYPAALLSFIYDQKYKRLSASQFVMVRPGTFYSDHPFPAFTANKARQRVSQDLQISLQRQTSDLIYYPSTDTQPQNMDQIGGNTPFDPIWRFKSISGTLLYLGKNNQVYQGSTFRVPSNYRPMP